MINLERISKEFGITASTIETERVDNTEI